MASNSILKNITDLADKLDPDRASDNYPKTRDPNYSIEVALDRIADVLDPEHAIEIEDKQKDPNYSIEASIQRICEHWPEGGGEMTVFDLYKDYPGVYSKLWPVIEDFYDKSQADMRNFIARGSAKIIDSDWTKLKTDLTTAITENKTIALRYSETDQILLPLKTVEGTIITFSYYEIWWSGYRCYDIKVTFDFNENRIVVSGYCYRVN